MVSRNKRVVEPIAADFDSVVAKMVTPLKRQLTTDAAYKAKEEKVVDTKKPSTKSSK